MNITNWRRGVKINSGNKKKIEENQRKLRKKTKQRKTVISELLYILYKRVRKNKLNYNIKLYFVEYNRKRRKLERIKNNQKKIKQRVET